jgi:hypothetical protein
MCNILKFPKYNKARPVVYLDGVIPAVLLQPGDHARLAARDAASTRLVCGEIRLVCSNAQLHPEAHSRTHGSQAGCTTHLQEVWRLEQQPALAE